MLVCEACDKGYHTSCTEPTTQGLPTSSWKCKVCPALTRGYRVSAVVPKYVLLSLGVTGCQPPTAPPDISASPPELLGLLRLRPVPHRA